MFHYAAMSERAELSLIAGQKLDLSLCEREPIHIPGTTQPHGAVIAARAEGLLVTHVSANLAAILGLAAEDILGRPLKHAIGKAACREISASTGRDGFALEPIRARRGARASMLNLHAHWSGESICIDIEPTRKEPSRRSAVTTMRSVLESFNRAKGGRELCERAVRGLKAMTGYDRVMAYRFDQDGHGEVIAEACADGMTPYLGLCYPVRDIPPQARRQYLLHPIGAIADSSYEPVPLLVDPALAGAAPLDLTHSALRSVSPVHREYMRNMKTAASLTIGLADGPRLWGMLVCHHATPRVAGPELRAVAATVGQVISLMLAGLGDAERARRTKEELANLRYYDSLTGLPNRGLLLERLAAIQHDSTTSLLFLDLDRFKVVNDTLGHAAGDRLLIDVARRLLSCAGPGHMVARLAGDEFVLLSERLDRATLTAIADRIRRVIEEPFEIDGRPCYLSASIGIATADQFGGDLIRAADMAMYAAKQSGGNRWMLYEASLHDRATGQFELDRELRKALGSDDQLTLVYQPVYALAPGARKLAGFEALLRWHHPRLGWMAPNSFIPLAEKSGLILPLGDWVLTRALREGRVLQQSCPHPDFQLAVNVSALQLAQPHFCASLAEMLEAEGFPASALCLEVTESMLTDAAASYVLTNVRNLGVRVAVDDFGTGYSSLSYLRRLPADIVKLDRSFLEDAEDNATAVTFIRSMIMLAHSAGMLVVMEGIETQTHLDIALAADADAVQGFLFARPLSATAAAELVGAVI
jgi:diguanylate cyclase (GGDEF)-like protein